MAISGAMQMEHEMVFPYGCYLIGDDPVTLKRDFNQSTREREVQEIDRDTGLPVWVVNVVDPDPEAKEQTVRVNLVAPVKPVPPEPVAGSPFRLVEFEGLTARPYAQTTANGRGKLAWSFKATGMKAPAGAKVPASSNGRNG
jgi:hypothetical protein